MVEHKETILLKDHTVEEFMEVTAGSEPVPGGGSVSALVGGISAALTQMVAGLTIGRKKYAEVDAEMRELVDKVDAIRKELVAGIDRDSEAYARVSAAYKLPKGNDWEIGTRTEAIQEATKTAAAVPMEVAKVAFELIPFIETVVMKGNQNAITDGCIAMMSCRLAVLGALLNVRINLGGIKDEAFVKQYSDACDHLEKAVEKAEKKILSHTYKQL